MTITHGVLDVYQLRTNFDGPQASGQVLLRAVDPHLLVLVLSRRLATSEEHFREVPSVLRLTSVCENSFKISENTSDLCPSPLCWCLLGRVGWCVPGTPGQSRGTAGICGQETWWVVLKNSAD